MFPAKNHISESKIPPLRLDKIQLPLQYTWHNTRHYSSPRKENFKSEIDENSPLENKVSTLKFFEENHNLNFMS